MFLMDLFLMTNTTSGKKIVGLPVEAYSEHCQTSKMELSVKKGKLTSHGILHYLRPANPSKNFSQLIMSKFIFSQYSLEKCCLCRDSLTLRVFSR